MTIDELAIEGTKSPQDYFGPIPELQDQGWVSVWGIHRDSETLDRSNYKQILEELSEKYELNEDYRIEGSNHWAVGWVDALMVRGLQCHCPNWEDASIYRHPDWESKGNKTWWCHTCGAFTRYRAVLDTMLEFHNRVEDYPILDEEAYSQMEWDEFTDWIEQEAGYYFNQVSEDDMPEKWEERWSALLTENHSRAEDLRHDFILEAARQAVLECNAVAQTWAQMVTLYV